MQALINEGKTGKLLLANFLRSIKSLTLASLNFLLFAFPLSVNAQCIRPFLSTESFEITPTHAGLVLPIPTELFSYSDCPDDAASECLISISIDNGGFTPTVAYLIYIPQNFDLSTLVEVKKASIIATAKDGSTITALAFQLKGDVITRIDIASNGNKTFILSIHHTLSDKYPQIEILQSFIRENVVVYGVS